MRASHDYPLSFVVVNQVSPSLSNTTSLGLPNFLVGPHLGIYPGIANGVANTTTSAGLFTPGRDVIFGNTTASNTTLVSTNFNVATQETSAFYTGFLKPIDLQTLNYFIRQGYPREMLFWLFTDSFELTLAGKSSGYHYSPPDDYGCNRDDPKHRCFIDWVHIATLTGLTVEEATQKTKESSKPSTYSRFCFNPVLAQQAKALMSPEMVANLTRQLDIPVTAVFGPTTKCGGTWDPTENSDKPQPDILPITVGPFTFRIIPRSAYGVFEFLGSVMKLERDNLSPAPDAYISPGRSRVTEPPDSCDSARRQISHHGRKKSGWAVLRPHLVQRRRLLRARASRDNKAHLWPVGTADRHSDFRIRSLDNANRPDRPIGTSGPATRTATRIAKAGRTEVIAVRVGERRDSALSGSFCQNNANSRPSAIRVC